MNERNVTYLKDQIKYTGFGVSLGDRLREKIVQGLDTFTLQYQTYYGQSILHVELYFSKSMTQDMYFFNAYVVNLSCEESERLIQTFYINKGNSITLKEAYNLMRGRAVHKNFLNKDGDHYKCWVQMDLFSTTPNGNYKLLYYHENYGYNLRDTLAKHHILELELEEYKESIIASLEKGNMQMVTFEIEGEEEIRFIEANPKFKSINIYDEHMQKQFSRQGPSTIKSVAEETPAPEEKTEKEVEKNLEQKLIPEEQEEKKQQHDTVKKVQNEPIKPATKRKKRTRSNKKT